MRARKSAEPAPLLRTRTRRALFSALRRREQERATAVIVFAEIYSILTGIIFAAVKLEVPRISAEGRPTRWTIPIRESSEKESPQFIRAILDSLHDHVAVVDTRGTIRAVNEAWQNFAVQNGAPDTSRVSVGANYLDVCRRAIKAGDKVAEHALSGVSSVLNGTQAHFVMDYECSSPLQERWFKMTALRQKQPGVGVVITHSDITDRKRSEEALRKSEGWFRLLTDSLPVLISYVDENQRYRFNNKGYEHWFGHPREYVAGKHLRQVLGKKAYEAIRPRVEAALSGRLVTFERVYTLQGGGAALCPSDVRS